MLVASPGCQRDKSESVSELQAHFSTLSSFEEPCDLPFSCIAYAQFGM